MKKKTKFTQINECLSYDDKSFRCVTVYKSPKGNNVRVNVDVANCYHEFKVEVFNESNLKWNVLFNENEIPCYTRFQYHIDADKKLSNFRSNEKLVVKHLEDIYGDCI